MRLWVLALCFGCGRISFDPSGGGDVDVVLLTSLEGTTVPAGSSVRIQPSLSIAEPGEVIELTTQTGTLRSAIDNEAPTLAITADATGKFPEIKLRVPISADDPITITASRPLGGDTDYTITAPRLVPAGGGIELADGFVGVLVGTAPVLVGREPRIAFPPPGTAYGSGVIVIAGGAAMPPVAVRFANGTVTQIVLAGTGPDEGVAQIAFGPPEYGGQLYVCAASSGSGDGIFTLSPSFSWSTWSSFNNCNGMTFDTDRVLGPSTDTLMLLNVNAMTTSQGDPLQTITTLDSSLPFGSSGWKLYVHKATEHAGGMYMLYPVDDVNEPNGQIRLVTGVTPFTMKTLVPSFEGPASAAFGNPASAFGDILYVTSFSMSKIIGIKPNGSQFTFAASGDPAAGDIAFGPDGALYVVDGDEGRLFKVTPES